MISCRIKFSRVHRGGGARDIFQPRRRKTAVCQSKLDSLARVLDAVVSKQRDPFRTASEKTLLKKRASRCTPPNDSLPVATIYPSWTLVALATLSMFMGLTLFLLVCI